MKIYVITKIIYGIKHICATSTDKDNSEYLRRMASKNDPVGNAEVEMFDDYKELHPIKGSLYKVFCFYDEYGNFDGDICCIETFLYGNYLDNVIRFEEEGLHGAIDHKKLSDGSDGYVCLVVAESKEKAEKIGIDMIQKYRAEEMGI